MVFGWFSAVLILGLVVVSDSSLAKAAKMKRAAPETQISRLLAVFSELEIFREKDKLEFSYCPDNTCDLVQVKGVADSVAADFALLYYFHGKTYVREEALVKFRAAAKDSAEGALKRQLGACKPKDVLCVLNAMQAKHGFKVLGRTFDEGEVCEGEESLGSKFGSNAESQEFETKCVTHEKFEANRKKQKKVSQ